MDSRSEQFLESQEEEKMRALDLAIEFEDSPRDKECLMIDAEFMERLARLDAAGGRLASAQEEIIAICAEIAATGRCVIVNGLPGPSPAASPAPSAKKAQPRSGGRARPIRGGVADDPAAAGEKQAWRKTVCSVCGLTAGSRVFKGVRYPILHKEAAGDNPCQGSFRAGLPVEP